MEPEITHYFNLLGDLAEEYFPDWDNIAEEDVPPMVDFIADVEDLSILSGYLLDVYLVYKYRAETEERKDQLREYIETQIYLFLHVVKQRETLEDGDIICFIHGSLYSLHSHLTCTISENNIIPYIDTPSSYASLNTIKQGYIGISCVLKRDCSNIAAIPLGEIISDSISFFNLFPIEDKMDEIFEGFVINRSTHVPRLKDLFSSSDLSLGGKPFKNIQVCGNYEHSFSHLNKKVEFLYLESKWKKVKSSTK